MLQIKYYSQSLAPSTNEFIRIRGLKAVFMICLHYAFSREAQLYLPCIWLYNFKRRTSWGKDFFMSVIQMKHLVKKICTAIITFGKNIKKDGNIY